MDSVNVLVTTPIGEDSFKLITAFTPKIRITDASRYFRGRYEGFASDSGLDALLAEAEVMYGLRLPQNLVARAPRLKWIQVMSAGAERFLTEDVIQSRVILTNVSGIHGTPISEYVLQFMLMFVKQAPTCFQLKQAKQWTPFYPAVLSGKTVGIIGLGSIGREVARLAKAFRMRVLATRRSTAARARYVDTMFPREQLPDLLSQSDFVVLAVPLTPETRNFFGEKELRAMKPTAYLMNIGRGGLVDEPVLIRALEEHWIAGAGLDVFATEPLPPESRFWELPNVIFSPHSAGGTENYNLLATKVFCDNLKRYLEGKRMHHVVIKKRGY